MNMPSTINLAGSPPGAETATLQSSPPRAVDSSIPRPSGRFTFVDGLRGIAAMGVVLFHLGPVGHFSKPLAQFVPTPLMSLWKCGFLGVPVFFVLSGFVIAYSQRGIHVTPRYLGRFALRRSLRLDPPYWATIVLVLMMNLLLNRMRPGREVPFPGWKVVLAHLFYLQDLLHLREINGVFWTLCLEVQFYLVLTILTGVAQRLPFRDRAVAGFAQGSRCFIFVPLALVSLAVSVGWLRCPEGLFLGRWYSFFLGVVVWGVIERSISVRWLWAYIALLCATLFTMPHLFSQPDATLWNLVVVMTAIALYTAASLGTMGRWLSGAWIQFLGAISYSLYLVHGSVGSTLNSLGVRACRGSPPLILAWIAMSVVASVGGAYVMYRLVELPAIRWAH